MNLKKLIKKYPEKFFLKEYHELNRFNKIFEI